jgi:hypothetical protein
MHDDFWRSFFLFLIFLPLVLLWAFALIDLFKRHDIHGGAKALWLVLIIVIPIFGALIYIAMRPSELNAPRPYTENPRDYPLPPADSAG